MGSGGSAQLLPGVVVLHPYWTFWEHTAPPSFRAARLELARAVATELKGGHVLAVEEAAGPEDAERLVRALSGRRVDAIAVLQTMAVPPTHVLPVLDAFPGAGVVIWALHDEAAGPRAGFDHSGITTQGATVGAPMLGNVLSRQGRPFELVLGRRADPAVLARFEEAISAAAAAGSLRRARIGRVGGPLPGYLHVDLDEAALRAATGMEVLSVSADEVLERFRAVDAARVAQLRDEVDADWELLPGVEPEMLERSLRVAAALEDLAGDLRLDAGAMNCHVPQIRFGEEIGVTPCYGLGRLTSRGIPWTCTGDLVTAVAMLTTKRLGGAALYHELETIDYATGELVIANSGEHDLAWLAPGERPRLGPNGWFCGRDLRCGVCAVFEAAPGPATLVAFTPHPDAAGGFRYVAARGELTSRRFPETGTVNGAFRFAHSPVEDAWARWAAAGVNHHSSATPGDFAGRVRSVARLLGVEAVVV